MIASPVPAPSCAAQLVLVTGATRRIGACIARTLHAAGMTVALHYRSDRAGAQELAGELNALRPDSAGIWQANLGDVSTANTLVADVFDRFGRLDALVNNASSFFPTPLGSMDETTWSALVDSNFKAPLFLAQAAWPHLKATRGSIVNITDIHAERPLRGYPLYCAAKGALLTLTRALALEMGPEVRVNAIAPGAILWPDDTQFPVAEQERIMAHALLKRAGTPDDIARAVRFLLTDAPYVTGQVLNVDGGRSAHL
jgi:pteridine reductase